MSKKKTTSNDGLLLPRFDIIQRIGAEYCKQNTEEGGFSYQQVIDRHIEGHVRVDLRFYDKERKVAVLVETKPGRFQKANVEQLMDYVKLEYELSADTQIIAILASTKFGNIRVWKIANGYDEELDDTKLKTFDEYVKYFLPVNINDKSKVLENTRQLNKRLHDNGIKEKLRSQFVGTCLLALKNGLEFDDRTTEEILVGIKSKLRKMLRKSAEKEIKLSLLEKRILQNKDVQVIESAEFRKLLAFIKNEILPYINEASTEGHDILSYFFTTFNKYVNREDKNQAFTPNHIAHFMCRIGGISRDTVILDPTCGSGTFLVQAMAQALSKCEDEDERNHVTDLQIYGIEADDNVYGLATTNMLIHGDGNSNIYYGSCFEESKREDEELSIWEQMRKVQEQGKIKGFDLVLMNPPYNASKSQVYKDYADTWGNTATDPSKGLCFVRYVADKVSRGRLLTLLPMQAAIGDSDIILHMKEQLLERHTLDAVFSLPSEMFYPGASSVACCMVFTLGKSHKDSDTDTFFGYFKDDGFEKRKGVGRVDVKNRWSEIEEMWYNLYKHRLDKPGYGVNHRVTASDEWCAEAYMETDYTALKREQFIATLRNYSAFLIQRDDFNVPMTYTNQCARSRKIQLNTENWGWFEIGDNRLFEIKKGKRLTKADMIDGDIPYIGAIDSNNGVSAMIANDEQLHEPNTITVSYNGSIAEAYYQDCEYWATDDVNVLYPHFKLNRHIAMFLTTILHNEKYRFNYGRKWKKELMDKSRIKLPVCADGNPDWKYMENYIKSLPYSANL